MNRKTLIIVLVAVAILIIVLSFFIKIPYTITSRGLIYPYKEWTLAKTIDGNLLNVLKDNKTNSINSYSVTQFIRGDASAFILNQVVFSNANINTGDTVGYIYSNAEQFKLSELEGKLATEKMMYEAFSTGEKPQDIQHQKEILDLALQEFESQNKIFLRVQKLFNDSLISKNDYDIAQNDLKVKEYKYKIAQSYLSSIQTGVKNEQLEVSKSLIQSIQFQIDQLKSKLKMNNILSPISGKIVKVKSSNFDANGNFMDLENIIKVVDMSRLLVVLPVEYYEISELKIGGKVNLMFGGKSVQGDIIEIGRAHV